MYRMVSMQHEYCTVLCATKRKIIKINVYQGCVNVAEFSSLIAISVSQMPQ